MTDEQLEKMGFREWTSHYEKEQEADRDKINRVVEGLGALSGTVSKLSANVETMMESQRGVYSRINRPWQWGVVVAGFTALLSLAIIMTTVMTLTVNPIKDSMKHMEAQYQLDVARNLELHIWFKETQDKGQKEISY